MEKKTRKIGTSHEILNDIIRELTEDTKQDNRERELAIEFLSKTIGLIIDRNIRDVLIPHIRVHVSQMAERDRSLAGPFIVATYINGLPGPLAF